MTEPHIVAWDIETHLIKPGMVAPKFVCLTTYSDGGKYEGKQIFVGDDALVAIRDILTNYRSVMHTFFDPCGVAAEWPELLPLIFKAVDEGRLTCTRVRQMIIDNAKGYLKFEWDEELGEYKKARFNLAYLVWRWFKVDISAKKKGEDIWRLRYNELDGVPLGQWPPEAVEYAIGDSVWTWKIYMEQESENGVYIPGEEENVAAAWALYLLGAWGVRTDETAVAALKRKLERGYQEAAVEAMEHGFIREEKKKGEIKFTKNTKAIMRAVYDRYTEMGLQVEHTNSYNPREHKPWEKVSIRRDHLIACKHPGLWAVAEVGKIQKKLTTYVPVLERGTKWPVCANYNAILETFRTSCSKPNLQNIPRKGDLRPCFIPREGHVFAFCDYDSLEMRTLAQIQYILFGHSPIADSIRAGKDPHVDLAAELLEVDYEDCETLYEEHDEYVGQVRQGCKIGNYGLAGGMGESAFIEYAKGYDMDISQEFAHQIREAFIERWNMRPYFRHCSDLTKDVNQPEVPYRYRHGNAAFVQLLGTGGPDGDDWIRGDVPYTAVCNGYFQSLAAAGAKRALYAVVKECYIDVESPLYGCRPWLFAHDEIGMEIPKSYGREGIHAAVMRLQELMVDNMKHYCPDVPIGASAALCRRWYKGAKAVYDDAGFMVPSKFDAENKKWVADV